MKRIAYCFLSVSLLTGALPSFACPELQGTYQLAGTQAFLYLQKQQQDNYTVLFKDEDGERSILPAIAMSEEDRKEGKIPECALVIPELGMFMPSNKDQSYNVTAQSQESVSTKTPGTEYVIMVMAGFYSDVIGVNKTEASLPDDVLQAFSQP